MYAVPRPIFLGRRRMWTRGSRAMIPSTIAAGSVGRPVVDDQDLEPRVLREHRLDQPRDVLALVVGRDDDEGALDSERALVIAGAIGV